MNTNVLMLQINIVMTGLLGSSWRSTLLAFIVAVGNLVLNGMTVKNALASAAIQAAGMLLKDASAHSTLKEVQQATNVAAMSEAIKKTDVG